MKATELGMVILDSDVQSSKASFPIEVTELGMFMLVNESHLQKVLSSMDVMDPKFSSFLNDVQYANA